MKSLFMLVIALCISITALSAQQISSDDRLSTLSPYIEDNRSATILGSPASAQPQNNFILMEGEFYPYFETKAEALDFFISMNEHQDHVIIYVNGESFEEEQYQIQRKILRKAYYDTPMEREIFTIIQIN